MRINLFKRNPADSKTSGNPIIDFAVEYERLLK